MKHKDKLLFKQKMKFLASEIKKTKSAYREAMANDGDYWSNQVNCAQMRKEFRHRHVALCLLRGRHYEKIETRSSAGNAINWALVEDYKAEYQALIDGSDEKTAIKAGNRAYYNFVAKELKKKIQDVKLIDTHAQPTFFQKVLQFFNLD